MPLYSFLPFGINTTVYQVASYAIYPSQNAVWTRSTSFSQCSPPLLLSLCLLFSFLCRLFSPFGRREPPFQVLGSHPRRPPDLFHRSFLTASSISSYVGTESSTFTSFTVTRMFSPRDVT